MAKIKQNPFHFVNRANFTAQRYEGYKLKAEKFKELFGPDFRDAVGIILTDLDKPCAELPGVPMRDCVVCDKCNGWIQEESFVMFEDSRCYHYACVKDSCGLQNPEPPVDTVGNLIFLAPRR